MVYLVATVILVASGPTIEIVAGTAIELICVVAGAVCGALCGGECGAWRIPNVHVIEPTVSAIHTLRQGGSNSNEITTTRIAIDG